MSHLRCRVLTFAVVFCVSGPLCRPHESAGTGEASSDSASVHCNEIPFAGFFVLVFFFRFFSPTSKRSAHTHGRTKGTFKIKADVGANANQSQETRKHKEITEGGNTRIRAGSSGTRGPSEMGSQKNIWRQQIFKFEHKQENKLSAVHLSSLIT